MKKCVETHCAGISFSDLPLALFSEMDFTSIKDVESKRKRNLWTRLLIYLALDLWNTAPCLR